MSRSQPPRWMHGTALAEVEIQMVGDFPAKWSSLELPSILRQLLERGAERSGGELENVRFLVRQKGVMSITSSVAPTLLDDLFVPEEPDEDERDAARFRAEHSAERD